MRADRIWFYYITVFLGAFLLFQIQPITSKALLPKFGGSYHVWGASMVFYQGVLLLGYWFVHVMHRRISVVDYGKWHWVFLFATFMFFPFGLGQITPSAELPLILSVFKALLLSVGFPFFVLSTISLVLQRWLAASELQDRVNPYILYSASNLGSILGLLSYPALLEPALSLIQQEYLWWLLYALLIFGHAFCRPAKVEQTGLESHAESVAGNSPFSQKWRWFLLSLATNTAFLSVTNVISFKVASAPFVWVLPLSIFLLSYVLIFKRRAWCPLWIQKSFMHCILIGFLIHLMGSLRLTTPSVVFMIIHLLLLFVICLNANYQLLKQKPDHPSALTSFYLVMSVGGVIGGITISWIMPVVSNSLVEFPIALLIAAGAITLVAREQKGGVDSSRATSPARKIMTLLFGVILMVVALVILPWIVRQQIELTAANMIFLWLVMAAVILVAVSVLQSVRHYVLVAFVLFPVLLPWTGSISHNVEIRKAHRNYYGHYLIFDSDDVRYLQHGSTLHGRQYLSEDGFHTPLSYYHPSTPVGEFLAQNARHTRQVGMIGLGAGALAAYFDKDQVFRIFELDPDNHWIAYQYFDYLREAEGRGVALDFHFGDGRQTLGTQADNSLDFLIVDAFNSGSVPTHLLTLEAFEEYFRVLSKKGVLFFHLSNDVLDLNPIVYSNARALSIYACEKNNGGQVVAGADLTYWMAVSTDPKEIQYLEQQLGWFDRRIPEAQLPKPWTDQYSNIIQVMKF